jgi:hypothetical protein
MEELSKSKDMITEERLDEIFKIVFGVDPTDKQ